LTAISGGSNTSTFQRSDNKDTVGLCNSGVFEPHDVAISLLFNFFSVKSSRYIHLLLRLHILHLLQFLHQQMLSSNITTSYSASNGTSKIIHWTKKTVYKIWNFFKAASKQPEHGGKLISTKPNK